MSIPVDRLYLGESHEKRVEEALRCRGWAVQPWGLGLIQKPFHIALQSQPHVVLWRWIPDIIAMKDQIVLLVDAKTEWRRDTPYFTLEINAYQSHLAMAALGLPIVYVWGDLTCNTPQRLNIIDCFFPDPGKRRVGTSGGSGTPFLRVRKDEQRSLDSWFGSPLDGAA